MQLFFSKDTEVFNSSLVYELAVLKKPALELLAGVKKESRSFFISTKYSDIVLAPFP